MLKDLLFYDQFLHKTYNDLSSFSNTAGLKVDKDKQDLKFDANADMEAKNYLEENAKYRGYVKKFMDAHEKMAMSYNKWLT